MTSSKDHSSTIPRWISTRGAAPSLSFSEAVLQGLAPDGGLYIPERMPTISEPASGTLIEVGTQLLQAWIGPDEVLHRELKTVLHETLNFPIPLAPLSKNSAESIHLLELFHGPTAAFKDVGARFLAAALARIPAPPSQGNRPRLVLVATSGDTGGAVASAFHGRPGIQVAILFPEGKVSDRQAHQLCAWGDNVRAFAVKGNFDDCQRMVKEAFLSPEWKNDYEMLSANSISVGRFAPQAIYYAWASQILFKQTGFKPGFVVPTGNLGNAVAALYARALGYPVGEIVLATNANRTLLEYSKTGKWTPRPGIATLANAMDVGAPSNFERLQALEYRPRVFLATDEEIKTAIRTFDQETGRAICPHTATAFHALQFLERDRPWVIVSTAHPAKFETIVEPLIGRAIPLPPELTQILSKPAYHQTIEPTVPSLRHALRN